MSNWALELQGFDIIRIWIRGEANILGDAPGRAPWEDALAKHMPIPDMPVRELVKKMYQDPDGLELLVTKRKVELLGEEGRWKAMSLEARVLTGRSPNESHLPWPPFWTEFVKSDSTLPSSDGVRQLQCLTNSDLMKYSGNRTIILVPAVSSGGEHS